jgi:hypothetical protein
MGSFFASVDFVFLVCHENGVGVGVGVGMFGGAASSGVNEVAGTCLHPAIRA